MFYVCILSADSFERPHESPSAVWTSTAAYGMSPLSESLLSISLHVWAQIIEQLYVKIPST